MCLWWLVTRHYSTSGFVVASNELNGHTVRRIIKRTLNVDFINQMKQTRFVHSGRSAEQEHRNFKSYRDPLLLTSHSVVCPFRMCTRARLRQINTDNVSRGPSGWQDARFVGGKLNAFVAPPGNSVRPIRGPAISWNQKTRIRIEPFSLSTIKEYNVE